MRREKGIPSSFERIERAFESFYTENPAALEEDIRETGEDPDAVFAQIDARVKARVAEHYVVSAAAKNKGLFEKVASRIRGKFDSLSMEQLTSRFREMISSSTGVLQPSFRDFEHMDEAALRSALENAEILREMNRISETSDDQ